MPPGRQQALEVEHRVVRPQEGRVADHLVLVVDAVGVALRAAGGRAEALHGLAGELEEGAVAAARVEGGPRDGTDVVDGRRTTCVAAGKRAQILHAAVAGPDDAQAAERVVVTAGRGRLSDDQVIRVEGRRAAVVAAERPEVERAGLAVEVRAEGAPHGTEGSGLNRAAGDLALVVDRV